VIAFLIADARWPPRAAAVCGLVWFIVLGGWPALDPTNLQWLLDGDWKQHLLGWLMFRHEPWTLPLGTLSNALYPVGSTIGFTDSNPLLSVLLKPFSSMLPEDFQFIGPWLALCFVLQAYTGAKLASVVTDEPRDQFLAGNLFALSPVLVGRIGHDTLCAHWILLALLYLGLRTETDDRSARRSAIASIALVVVAAGTHPYLAAMGWMLALAVFAKLWRLGRARLWRAVAYAAAATIAMMAVFALFGYLGGVQVAGGGFGEYSADLLALVNPMQYSHVLPRLPMKAGQWEGLGFLGLGGLLAVLVAGVVLVRTRRRLPRHVWPVAAACAVMAVYSLSPDVKLAGRDELDLGWLYEPLMPLVAPFRASGRFIWPLHYLLLGFGVWGLVRAFARAPRTTGTALLLAALALQAGDLTPDPGWSSPKAFRRASDADFQIARGHYRHVALFPMQVLTVCDEGWNENHVFRFMLVAYRLKATFNSGIYSRLRPDDVRPHCKALEQDVDTGRLDPQTIYIVNVYHLWRFQKAGAVCSRSDGDWICVSRDSDPVFRTYLETGKVIGR
jgi:hypothetical protein